MTFTFKMKSGITFSSGNPVTAEDAAFRCSARSS
ncbi:hypothetical protein ACFSHQ_08375 [Gemmobacter lanyuensis]